MVVLFVYYDFAVHHCSIRVHISIFRAKHDMLQLLNFTKANPAPFKLKYNFQPVVTSFISIALGMTGADPGAGKQKIDYNG